jgi:hypothetical protein
LLTIFATACTISLIEVTQSTTFLKAAFIWLFQATTEQPIFVGLMGYRLGWNARAMGHTLKAAALQAWVCKSISAIALLILWGIEQRFTFRAINYAWSALLWITCVGLLMIQWYVRYQPVTQVQVQMLTT